MKFLKILMLVIALSTITAYAGGIVSNTNQGAAYARKLSLNATNTVDAVYYNPAGLVKLKDGWHFSVSNQTVMQTAFVNTSFPGLDEVAAGNEFKEYQGDIFAPIYPNAYAVWKKDKLAVSFGFNIIGGGGSAEFANGLPSFEQPISTIPGIVNSVTIPTEAGDLTLPTSGYQADIFFKGTSVYYGGQLGVSYAITDWVSAFAGCRVVYASNHYEGHIKDVMINPNNPVLGLDGSYINAAAFFTGFLSNPMLPEAYKPMINQLIAGASDKYVDVDQTALGFTPIVGVNFSLLDDKLTIAATYEFKTGLILENATEKDDTGQFQDGVETPADIPAFIRAGIEYDITDDFRVNVGYNQYFDKGADWGGREDLIDNGMMEIHGSLEYDITDKILVSAGYSHGITGVTPEYQTDMSFSLSSNTFAVGGAYQLTENMQLNLGYFQAFYDESEQETAANPAAMMPAYMTKFDKSTSAFALGINFSF